MFSLILKFPSCGSNEDVDDDDDDDVKLNKNSVAFNTFSTANTSPPPLWNSTMLSLWLPDVEEWSNISLLPSIISFRCSLPPHPPPLCKKTWEENSLSTSNELLLSILMSLSGAFLRVKWIIEVWNCFQFDVDIFLLQFFVALFVVWFIDVIFSRWRSYVLLLEFCHWATLYHQELESTLNSTF